MAYFDAAGNPIAAPESGQKEVPLEHDFEIGQMVRNIPQSGKQFLEDTTAIIHSPIETLGGLGRMVLGLGGKAGIPGLDVYEENANAVGKYFADRYGGVEEFQRSLQNDPVGVVGDLATLASGGAAATARVPGAIGRGGRVLKQAAQATDPVNLGLSATRAAIGKAAPTSWPRELYESAAKWPTTMDIKKPGSRRAITETALRENIMPNEAGVARLEKRMRDTWQGVDDLITRYTKEGRMIPVAEVMQNLGEGRRKIDMPGPDRATDLAKYDDFVNSWIEDLQLQGRDTLTPFEVNELKKRMYERIKFDRRGGTAQPAVETARRDIAKGAAQAEGTLDPQIRELNRQYGELRELRDPLVRSSGRVSNLDPLSITEGITAAGAEAVAPGVGGKLGWAAALANKPQVRGRMARKLWEMQQPGGGNIFNSPLWRTLLAQSGGLQQRTERNR
jgi:hypothetical protein